MTSGEQRPHWLRRSLHSFARVLPFVVLVVICVGLVIHQRERYERFGIHDLGKVYRSSWLTPDAMAEVVAKHRIHTVINLCKPTEYPERQTAEAEAVRAVGAEFKLVSFPNNATSHATADCFREMEAIFDDPARYPILVHCYHGRERTAKALAIYDVRLRRLTAEQSVRGLKSFDSKIPDPILEFVHNYERWCIDSQVQEASRRESDSIERR